VVLAASICTKGGKPVISRQFREMTRARIESLLASFPKLMPANTQHTSVETPDVRYVYQPLEDLYILLITNKASNILQDIDTLSLLARVVSDMCSSSNKQVDERAILRNAFELLGAFDEVVSLGWKEPVTLMQVRNILEMESHEEKIQEIIAKNKEHEAKEELKRRAKQLEMQRREQQRRVGSGGGGFGGGLGGGATGYSPVPRYDAPEPSVAPKPVTPTPRTTAPAFKGSGMKLGANKTKQAELLDALGGDMLAAAGEDVLAAVAESAPQASSPPPALHSHQKASGRGSVPEVEQKVIHITIRESLTLCLLRDGGVESMELKGDMMLLISDAASARLRLNLGGHTSELSQGLQLKQHPNVVKFPPGNKQRVIALKDPKRSFPVGQELGVLKWRYVGTDETRVPLSINVWPSPTPDGTCEVSIEYELENEHIELYDLRISIPLPPGSYPTVSSHTGEWQLDPALHSLVWTVPRVSTEGTDKNGSIVFSVAGDDVGAFFPVEASFVASGSMAGISVESVELIDGGKQPEYSVDALLTSEEYQVI
ncbi:hypothetical protein FISHEDRAFT_49861, partial [Fistulina hepatica ATCC 64428]